MADADALLLGGLALFGADFLVERVFQLVRRFLELGDALAERLAQFRELSRAEHNQRDREDDDELRKTYISHIDLNYTPLKSARMRSMRIPRFFTMAALAVLLSALAGGFLGARAQATQDQVSTQYRVFTAALAAVNREYVDKLPADRPIYDAIGGMLQTLDPHSSFFDPKAYAQMRERQSGSYYGIGLSIQTIN